MSQSTVCKKIQKLNFYQQIWAKHPLAGQNIQLEWSRNMCFLDLLSGWVLITVLQMWSVSCTFSTVEEYQIKERMKFKIIFVFSLLFCIGQESQAIGNDPVHSNLQVKFIQIAYNFILNCGIFYCNYNLHFFPIVYPMSTLTLLRADFLTPIQLSIRSECYL